MEIDKNGPSSIGYSSKILFQQKQGALRNNARNLYVWGLQIFMTCELDLEQGLNIDNRNPAIIKLNDKDEIHPDDGFIIKGFSSQEDYVIAQSDSSLVSGGPFYHYLILEDANQQNPSNMIACYFKFNATIRNYTCLYINEGFSFQSGLRGHKPQISQASFIAQRDQITYLVLINFGDKEMVKKQLQVYNDKSLKMVSAFDRDQTKTLFFGVGFLTQEFSFQGSTTSPYSTYTSGFILEHQSSTCYLNSLQSLNYKITTTPLQPFSSLSIVDPAASIYANKFTKFALVQLTSANIIVPTPTSFDIYNFLDFYNAQTSCIKPGSIFFPTTQYYDYYISQTSLNTSAPYNITTENIFFDGTKCPNDSFTFQDVLIQPLKGAVYDTTTPTKLIYEVLLFDSDINKTFNVTQTYTLSTSIFSTDNLDLINETIVFNLELVGYDPETRLVDQDAPYFFNNMSITINGCDFRKLQLGLKDTYYYIIGDSQLDIYESEFSQYSKLDECIQQQEIEYSYTLTSGEPKQFIEILNYAYPSITIAQTYDTEDIGIYMFQIICQDKLDMGYYYSNIQQ
eukprot:403359374